MSEMLNMANARKPEQAEKMRAIAVAGICPFCPEHLADNHKEPIARENEHWFLTRNDWPYEGTKHHWLLIAKRHVRDVDELTPAETDSLFEMVRWLKKEYDIAGGSFLMRTGDTRFTGATVTHLHAHFISGSAWQSDKKPGKDDYVLTAVAINKDGS